MIVRVIGTSQQQRSVTIKRDVTESDNAEGEDAAQLLDRLCLALGLLTNLVQVSSTTADMVRELCT